MAPTRRTPTPPVAQPRTVREATAEEKAISQALAAGAFGLVGLAIFAATSVFDKIANWALQVGNLLTVAAVISFVVSIICSGRGLAYGVRPGRWNIFGIQALTGLAGIIALAIAAAIFVFNPKLDDKSDIKALQSRVEHLERITTEQEHRLHDLMSAPGPSLPARCRDRKTPAGRCPEGAAAP